MEAATEERQRHERMIEDACGSHGLTIDDWSVDEDNSGRVQAHLGDWRAIEDDESEGLFEGDEGKLTASVVGGVEYGNEQVAFYLRCEGMDSPIRVNPQNVEPA